MTGFDIYQGNFERCRQVSGNSGHVRVRTQTHTHTRARAHARTRTHTHIDTHTSGSLPTVLWSPCLSSLGGTGSVIGEHTRHRGSCIPESLSLDFHLSHPLPLLTQFTSNIFAVVRRMHLTGEQPTQPNTSTSTNKQRQSCVATVAHKVLFTCPVTQPRAMASLHPHTEGHGGLRH